MNRGPDVAVALIESRTQPEYFLVQRRAMENKQYPGWLEFPGGKLEKEETPLEALIREVNEEVGLLVYEAKFLCAIESVFPSGLTHLVNFFVVIPEDWRGKPIPQEKQRISWLTLYQIQTYHKMLPLNRAAALILTTERHPDILD